MGELLLEKVSGISIFLLTKWCKGVIMFFHFLAEIRQRKNLIAILAGFPFGVVGTKVILRCVRCFN